jgi:hypothetical protein
MRTWTPEDIEEIKALTPDQIRALSWDEFEAILKITQDAGVPLTADAIDAHNLKSDDLPEGTAVAFFDAPRQNDK